MLEKVEFDLMYKENPSYKEIQHWTGFRYNVRRKDYRLIPETFRKGLKLASLV
jgi:hypothetical protein